MKIIHAFPPNYQEIKKVLNPPTSTVFTYGDTIYNPGRGSIPSHLSVHEETHCLQQGDSSAKWWRKYLKNPLFRLNQEMEAYQNQYIAYILEVRDRNQRARFLHKIAQDLSGAMYGHIISYDEAIKEIASK